MGLIKSIVNATSATLGDAWVDYFACSSIDETVLMCPGQRVKGKNTSNTKYTDNIITNGSKIDVADGQFMMIVENGKVVDYCAEPGQYTYDSQTQPSLLGGGFKDLGPMFAQIGKRFLAGGQVTDTQKVYYINTKEIYDNKIGFGNIPFRDSEFQMTVTLQGFGVYSYKITNPLTFYKNIAGNVDTEFKRSELDNWLKSEITKNLQPALGKIAKLGISYDQIINYPVECGDAIRESLNSSWYEKRGISLESIDFSSIVPDEKSQKDINELQKTRAFGQNGMADTKIKLGQASAFENMGKNSNGASGMDMMGMAFGMQMMQNMNQMNGIQPQAPVQQAPVQTPVQPVNNATTWVCTCGATVTGKFCAECGKPKPADTNGWTCSCGAVNKGKFCSECGSKKPTGALLYKCDKCGWEPEDPANPPKFCPECGDPFSEEDVKN